MYFINSWRSYIKTNSSVILLQSYLSHLFCPALILFPLVRETSCYVLSRFSQSQLHGAEQSFIVFLKILLSYSSELLKGNLFQVTSPKTLQSLGKIQHDLSVLRHPHLCFSLSSIPTSRLKTTLLLSCVVKLTGYYSQSRNWFVLNGTVYDLSFHPAPKASLKYLPILYCLLINEATLTSSSALLHGRCSLRTQLYHCPVSCLFVFVFCNRAFL